MGDFLYCLPIASHLAKTRGVKIHFVLPECFPPFRYITPLIEMQPFTEKVTLVNHQCNWSGHAGQPYKFNPATHGIPGPFYNLGFRGYPNKFVTDYVAEEYGLGVDNDFTLNLGEFTPNGGILRSEQPEVALAVPEAEQIPIPADLLTVGRLLAGAKERHLWYSGPAAMMFLARIAFDLHFVEGHPPRRIYLPPDRFGGALIRERKFVAKT